MTARLRLRSYCRLIRFIARPVGRLFLRPLAPYRRLITRSLALPALLLVSSSSGQDRDTVSRTAPVQSPAKRTADKSSLFLERAELMVRTDVALADKEFQTVRDLVGRVLRIEEDLFGAGHWKTMESLNRFADVSVWLDDFSAAIQTRQRIHRWQQDAYGEQSWQANAAYDLTQLTKWRAARDPENRQALTEIDSLFRDSKHSFEIGDVAKATRMMQDCLARYRAVTANGSGTALPHPAILQCVISLTHYYSEQGLYGQAFATAQSAVKEAERLYPIDRFPVGHPDFATCHCALSALQTVSGDIRGAHRSAIKAVGICSQLHPSGAKPEADRITAMSLRMLAAASRRIGQGGATKQLLDGCQSIVNELYPATEYPLGHQTLAVTLEAIGAFHFSRSEYAESLGCYRRALAMRRRLYPNERFPLGHRRLAASYSRIADVLSAQNQFASADKHHQQALAMYRQLYPVEEYPRGHLDLSRQIASLGRLALDRGDVQRASTLGTESLEMVESLRADNTHAYLTDLVRAHEHLGQILRREGKYHEARDHYVRALQAAQQLYPTSLFPAGHRQLFDCYNSMGVVAWHQQDFSQAAHDFERALSIANGLPESISPLKRVVARQNLATLLYAQQHLTTAAQEYEASLQTLRDIFPTTRYPVGHVQLANTLMNLGATRSALGDYQLAAHHFEEAAEMLDILFPAEENERGHPAHFQSLVNLGSALCQIGEYAKARECLERAVRVGLRRFPSSTFPDGHESLASAFTNLSNVCHQAGEFKLSLQYSEQALAMSRGLYSPDDYPRGHADLATRIHNLGASYIVVGDCDTARRYLFEALEMRRRLFPTEEFPLRHSQIVISLNAIAFSYLHEDRIPESRPFVNAALRTPSTSEDLRPSVVESLEAASVLEFASGNYAGSIEYIERSIELLELLHPSPERSTGHQQLARALGRAAAAYHAAGRLNDARKALSDANTMNRVSAERLLPMLSEAEGLNYLASQPRIRNRLLTVAAALGEPPEQVYKELWSTRGAVQKSIAARRRLMKEAEDESSRRRYQLWLDRGRQIAQLTIVSPTHGDSSSFEDRRERLKSLTQEKEKLERELAELVVVHQSTAAEADPVEAMKLQLPVQSAFVDIRFYTRFDYSNSERPRQESRTNCYVAFLQSRGGTVARVELGPSEPIAEAIRNLRQSVATGSIAEFDKFAGHLRKAVWLPIENELPAGTDTIFICPDGALTALPWGALPGAETGSVLLERYAFAQVPYGDFLLERLSTDQPSEPPSPLLVVGDVDYERPSSSETSHESQYVSRAPVGGDQRPSWQSLPATQAEVAQVAEIARESGQTVVLSGVSASTGNVLTALPQARRAHFATHGFFADAEFRSAFQLDPELFEKRSRLMRAERTRIAGRNPLILSGIVLSGANNRTAVSPPNISRGDGGILTGETIAGLELSELDLVTLSACDTGLGDVGGNEGVFGLQRAFHVAGAKTVVASLWKVEGEATQKLMVNFYRNLYQEQMSKLQALRLAQLSLRGTVNTANSRRGLVRERVDGNGSTAEQPTKPMLWASWTLSGDWR